MTSNCANLLTYINFLFKYALEHTCINQCYGITSMDLSLFFCIWMPSLEDKAIYWLVHSKDHIIYW